MKNILIGVCGGIAAYKSANIISKLKKNGHNVKVIMTKNATEIISPLTLETLSRNKVSVDMWDKNKGYEVEHISLAEWADICLIVPATYNIIGKISNGIADDLLSTVISACTCKKFIALAMNVNMYNNPILKENIEKLKKYNYTFIDCDEGFLACNTNAKGRLKNEDGIIEIVEKSFSKRELLKGKKILLTAGRTEEPLDPIRYFSNNSSGTMGYSIAIKAIELGAEVVLISGPTNLPIPIGLKTFIQVKTAEEMYSEVLKRFENTDIGISCAAVADYKPKICAKQKIKKDNDELIITLTKNPDILYNMGLMKKKQILIGFAAETENIIENATKKLKKKNLDMIVANHAENMRSSNNSATFIKSDGSMNVYENKPKLDLAYDILMEIYNLISVKSLDIF